MMSYFTIVSCCVIALAVANPQRSPFLPSLNLNKFQQQQEGKFGPQPQQFNENFLPAFQGQPPMDNNQLAFDWNFNQNGPNGGGFNGFPQQQQPNLNQQQVNQQLTNQQISSQQPWNQQPNQQSWNQQPWSQQRPNQQQTKQIQLLLDLLQPNQQQSNQQQSNQHPNQEPNQQPNQSNINQNLVPNPTPTQSQNQIQSSNSNQNPTSNPDLPIDIAPVFPFAFPAFPPEFLKCMRQDCLATSEYNPVCGSDRTIYTNDRKLGCANYCGRRLNPTNWTEVRILRDGNCSIRTPISCC